MRAPTAPQACWALEQHTDELAAAVGMDPVEFRRTNCIDTGDEGPTRQVYLPIGLHECLANAVEMSDYGQELPEDEAIGVAVGWWPTFGVPSGAYVKLNADGSGVIVTGAQECGTGSVMTLPMLAADELGMQPEDFTLVYQDTDAGPWDMGATGSQTLVNNGRAVVAAAKQVGEQLRQLAADQMEASPGGHRARRRLRTGQGLARQARSRSPSSQAPPTAASCCSAPARAPPGGPRDRQRRTASASSAWTPGRRPQVSCHAVRVQARPRHGRRARARGLVLARLGHDHQRGRRRGPGRGRRHDGHGPGALGGHEVRRRGPQLNAALLEYKLQTMPDAPPITVKWVQTNAPDGGPRGSKGVAEAPNVATAAAIANALAKLTGGPLRKLPMTPERIWEHMQELRLVNYTAAHTLDEAARGRRRGRPPGRGRLRPRRRRPAGQVPAAREPRRHPRRRRPRRHRRARAARSCWARSSTTPRSRRAPRSRPAGRAWPTAARSWARPRRVTSARSAATS